MKLVKPRTTNSFFESFSDLIFATMAIFVLLLIVFISQTGEDAPRRIEFTGSSADTFSLIAHAEVDGVPSVVFFPVIVADGLNVMRIAEVNDPLLTLCRLALSADGITHLPISEYVRMASGFSRSFAMGIRSQGEGTIEASLLLEAVASGTFSSPEELKASVFGPQTMSVVSTGSGELTLGDRWVARYAAIRSWLAQHDRGNFHSWISESREPVRARAPVRDDNRAIVEYHDKEGRIGIGEATLTVTQFRGFLSSIRAGRDFALVHVDEAGVPSPPPKWVLEEVLEPAGYTAAK